MTFTRKAKRLDNGYVIEITQDKFSDAYAVEMIDNFGRIERKNYYPTIETAKRCFYRYCSDAKHF